MNHYGKNTHVKNLKSVILDFYSCGEIAEAKETLYNELRKVNMNILQHINRRQGDNRGEDCDDLTDYVTRTVEQGVLVLLPTFVAAKLDRIPSVKPQQLDICLLLKMTNIEKWVDSHDELLVRSPQRPQPCDVNQTAETATEETTTKAAGATAGETPADDTVAADTWAATWRPPAYSLFCSVAADGGESAHNRWI